MDIKVPIDRLTDTIECCGIDEVNCAMYTGSDEPENVISKLTFTCKKDMSLDVTGTIVHEKQKYDFAIYDVYRDIDYCCVDCGIYKGDRKCPKCKADNNEIEAQIQRIGESIIKSMLDKLYLD